MEGFTADWLALREPVDARARSATLTKLVADRLQRVAEPRVLDLGAGTGANVRYLAKYLPGRRRWLLVDHDRLLLADAFPAEAIDGSEQDRVEVRAMDLASAFEQRSEDLCAGRDLITSSALLDLVSEPWLLGLATKCLAARAAVLFALTYNGVMRCSPEEPEDDAVRELVNLHQRTDKGFGPALGPDGSDAAVRVFAAFGYEVWRERSDWVLEADAGDLQVSLVEGWAEAAGAVAPDRASSLQNWKARRLAHVAAGSSQLIVGHEDLVGWL